MPPLADLLIGGEEALKMASHLLELVLALVPPEHAKALIDDLAVKQGNEVADAAEEAKFGKKN